MKRDDLLEFVVDWQPQSDGVAEVTIGHLITEAGYALVPLDAKANFELDQAQILEDRARAAERKRCAEVARSFEWRVAGVTLREMDTLINKIATEIEKGAHG